MLTLKLASSHLPRLYGNCSIPRLCVQYLVRVIAKLTDRLSTIASYRNSFFETALEGPRVGTNLLSGTVSPRGNKRGTSLSGCQ